MGPICTSNIMVPIDHMISAYKRTQGNMGRKRRKSNRILHPLSYTDLKIWDRCICICLRWPTTVTAESISISTATSKNQFSRHKCNFHATKSITLPWHKHFFTAQTLLSHHKHFLTAQLLFHNIGLFAKLSN